MTQPPANADCTYEGNHVVNANLPDGVMADLIAGDNGGSYSRYSGGCFSDCVSGCLFFVVVIVVISIVLTALLYACVGH